MRFLDSGAEIVERFKLSGQQISAKTVRNYIQNGEVDKALELVPQSTRAVLKMILSGKNV